MISASYERIPPFCFDCDRLVHVGGVCKPLWILLHSGGEWLRALPSEAHLRKMFLRDRPLLMGVFLLRVLDQLMQAAGTGAYLRYMIDPPAATCIGNSPPRLPPALVGAARGSGSTDHLVLVARDRRSIVRQSLEEEMVRGRSTI